MSTCLHNNMTREEPIKSLPHLCSHPRFCKHDSAMKPAHFNVAKSTIAIMFSACQFDTTMIMTITTTTKSRSLQNSCHARHTTAGVHRWCVGLESAPQRMLSPTLTPSLKYTTAQALPYASRSAFMLLAPGGRTQSLSQCVSTPCPVVTSRSRIVNTASTANTKHKVVSKSAPILCLSEDAGCNSYPLLC